ncbi:MAG TPA: DNA polymerase IV [Steroidobacteraceae bacterium]|jgi:DNA polymerase-4|nr:DNA polymerase IV [Steroidobacteraceae bacterium]
MRRGDARAILHIDMDAFYASVEERDRPELKGKPLIVGGTGGRGVVAAANYVVRRFGVRSAMPMREALRRCPQAICVRPRMTRYQEVSEQVFAIFHEFTPLVEGLSLDEAFLDVTSSQQVLGSAESIGGEIRRRVVRQTGLTASVGVAPNKLLAKIASDLNKPDGMCRIGADNMRDILDGLPIERLFGVGARTLPAVHAAGIRSFGDLREAGDEVLWRLFGKHGRAMRDRASGLDDRPVEPNREEKSISAEETFAADIRSPSQLGARLLGLADRAASRLRAHELAAGSVSVKIRRGDFKTYTRQHALEPPTQDTATLAAAATVLLERWLATQPDAAVRLLGVGVSDLQILRQADLFAPGPTPNSRLDSAIDGIRGRFGSDMLTRASLLSRSSRGSEPG